LLFGAGLVQQSSRLLGCESEVYLLSLMILLSSVVKPCWMLLMKITCMQKHQKKFYEISLIFVLAQVTETCNHLSELYDWTCCSA